MSKENPNLKQQIDKLEELIAWFDTDDVDLEQAIEKFETGTKLAEDIKKRLQTLENKITVLKEKFDSE